MATLDTRVAALENVQMIQKDVARSIEHTVGRDEQLRSDSQVQSALDRMATKEELKVLQRQLDEQTEPLKVRSRLCPLDVRKAASRHTSVHLF